ncbi:DNA/RNA non-specific endonuclease [Pedobacter hartonius]|uniref:Endonuclease G n=1 Tax=Pedobacter hartonius TaxID=425514 RepID=A0A1H4G3H9_9SPHI|nr:DNA/RNA non-specific endonuclease [Pedobacter hartonius]SEB04163.1 endonuclease G [Pedobacter hartonius]
MENIQSAQLEMLPDDFNDRDGFIAEFLGEDFKVSLPTVERDKDQVLLFELDGKEISELKYRHFSVVMNSERRMCFFSACNIDGLTSIRGVQRSSWKTDPRIDQKLQIIKECYGDPPKFSRGHMTRKEDPIWGTLPLAQQAGADTFHVTNATPQMQPFNAPVWLELENYALENARQDQMRISVITGPVFSSDDPEKYGLKIPVDFFKIIAFIHDETKMLTATGYTISQQDYFSPQEFIYGPLKTYQVSISTIEERTGLKFGNLSSVDPIKGQQLINLALGSVQDIRFI